MKKTGVRDTSELKTRLSGWQAVVVIIFLIGIVVVRLLTLDDMTNDKDLMKHIDTLLMDEYAPYVADKMRAAVDSVDNNRIEKAADSVASTKVNIVSVQASYPIFKFSLPKDVVIKVVFSLDDFTATGEKQIIYYLFKYGTLGWQYNYITNSMSYYLNFM